MAAPVGHMVVGATATWVVGAAVAPRFLLETFTGMLGPLLVAVASWAMVEQTFRRDPARLTGVMVTAFAGKMVFFGAYVAVMLLGLSMQTLPFVVSFTAYFIGLHLFEALCLRRLFGDSRRGLES